MLSFHCIVLHVVIWIRRFDCTCTMTKITENKLRMFYFLKSERKCSLIWNFLILTKNFLSLTLKKLGEGVSNRPCEFSETVFSRERVYTWFFVTFSIITSYIFPENLIEVHQIVQKIWGFSSSILAIFAVFSDFLTIICCKKTNDVSI